MREVHMGKTTLIHPVGLHVLRGAAQYGGFVLGRLKQTDLYNDNQNAIYDTPVKSVPADLKSAGLQEIKRRFQELFASDVVVTRIWRTKGGVTMVEIITGPIREPESE